MSNKEKIIHSIYKAIDEVNQQFSEELRLEKSLNTSLLGGRSKLDSLGFVTLIVTIEQKIEEELGISISLMDKVVVSQQIDPFETIGALSDYIFSLIKENCYE
jgi:acyl carrier protein